MDREKLYKFFEGTTSYEEEVAIRQWMEFSPENRRIFLKERRLFDSMLLLGKEEEIKNKKVRWSVQFSSLRTELIKITAIVTLTLTANYFYEAMALDTNPLLAMQTISVPAGQRVNIALADGTNVWLNAGTTLQYPVVFNKKNRRVILDGEAYFDVVKDKNRPFIVQTDKYNVEVFGTEFNVEAYSDTNGFETTLRSGSVKVESVSDPEQMLMLKPDHKATLQDGKLQVAVVDDYNSYRWKEGLICFSKATFASMMKNFEKYYGLTIYINNQNMHKYLFTGKFRLIDGIDYALKILQKDIQFTYKRDSDYPIIYIE